MGNRAEVIDRLVRRCKVKTTLPVDLPRPRDRSSPAFTQIRRPIYGEFFKEADRPFADAI